MEIKRDENLPLEFKQTLQIIADSILFGRTVDIDVKRIKEAVAEGVAMAMMDSGQKTPIQKEQDNIVENLEIPKPRFSINWPKGED